MAALMAHRIRVLILGAIALLVGLGRVAEASVDAGSLKAIMVYNFARFATWPRDRFIVDDAQVVLCVAPASPLAPALAALNGQPVGARRLSVRVTNAVTSACHMAYVDADGVGSVRAIQQMGVLTVGEGAGFPGALGFVSVGRQIRFAVNVRAAREAGVQLSSQLLRVAMAVRP
jgi:hypothetical protein